MTEKEEEKEGGGGPAKNFLLDWANGAKPQPLYSHLFLFYFWNLYSVILELFLESEYPPLGVSVLKKLFCFCP